MGVGAGAVQGKHTAVDSTTQAREGGREGSPRNRSQWGSGGEQWVSWVLGWLVVCHGEQVLFGGDATASWLLCCPVQGQQAHYDFREFACCGCARSGAGWRVSVTGRGTSPLQETPVPSMVTLHTAQTGGFFRKTFSRKLCGSAFLGWGWRDTWAEVSDQFSVAPPLRLNQGLSMALVSCSLRPDKAPTLLRRTWPHLFPGHCGACL